MPKAAARSAVARAMRPKSGEAEGGARNILAQKQFWSPSGELSGSGELVRFDGTPCGRKDEQHRQVGGGLREDAGGVAYDDAVTGRGGYVDVVVADGVVRDSGQFRLGEQIGVEPVAELGDHDVELSRAAGFAEFLGVRGASGYVHPARGAQ